MENQVHLKLRFDIFSDCVVAKLMCVKIADISNTNYNNSPFVDTII